MLQHSAFSVPRYDDGYCLDDNARALLLMTLLEDAGTDDSKGVRALAARYLAFVSHAFDERLGRFRNFMSYDRRWMETAGSDDSQGRALWALGTVVGRSWGPGTQSLAVRLFQAAVPTIAQLSSPRAWAFTLLGIDEYLRAFQGDTSVQSLRNTLATKLLDLYRRTSGPGWPWFEDRLTYCNPRLSHALIVSGSSMEHAEMKAAGLDSLEWLVGIQRSADGYFSPIGSNGFFERGKQKAEFDQQPVEAYSMVSACLEARRATGDRRWGEPARRAFRWFLGQNQLQQPLYDVTTGGCRDGLQADRVN